MGVAEALRRLYRDVKAVAVEPAESAIMSGLSKAITLPTSPLT
jgi:cysteine synthase